MDDYRSDIYRRAMDLWKAYLEAQEDDVKVDEVTVYMAETGFQVTIKDKP